MHIVCPHCSTSYAINLATLGAAGRTVRCSRCKEVWLARPEDATEIVAETSAMAAAGREAAEQDAAGAWDAVGHAETSGTPHVDSPSIAGDWTNLAQDSASTSAANWPSVAHDESYELPATRQRRPSWLRRILGSKTATGMQSGPNPGEPRKSFRRKSSAGKSSARKSSAGLPAICAAMGATAVALLIWRVEVVRLLPQTAAFYRLAGLDVNLRGLRFRDVKVTSETVEGKPVLVIEGFITGETGKPIELPRLRFSVRDAQGAEIYAWNSVIEQPVLKPGEKASFKSRLASPPPEGRNIDVRFFSKRDLAGGRI
jgi:predicted Zn finger-like uncharacterized protein